MDFSQYFEPFDPGVFPDWQPVQNTLGERSRFVSFLDELVSEDIRLVFIGVGEGRNAAGNSDCSGAPDVVRKELYALYPDECSPKMGDLGNLIIGETAGETYYKLQEVLEELLKKGILPIIVGGGNELAYTQYNAYKAVEQMVTAVSVDASFDFGHLGGPFDSKSFTERMITDEPTHLYSYTNIGYQAYLTDPAIVQMMSKLSFDLHRLANTRGNIEVVEPALRNADLLYFDIGAVRAADAPGNANVLPNGLMAEEACKLMKYAGLSDKLSSVGIYEYNPVFDINNTTAKLIAQMLWCFIEGFYQRKGDYPFGDTRSYQKFIVENEELTDPLVFYKSDKSGRWWIEVPRTGTYSYHINRQRLVPCSYRDYEAASQNRIPEAWWSQLLKG